MEVESLYDGADFSETLTRAKFEELNAVCLSLTKQSNQMYEVLCSSIVSTTPEFVFEVLPRNENAINLGYKRSPFCPPKIGVATPTQPCCVISEVFITKILIDAKCNAITKVDCTVHAMRAILGPIPIDIETSTKSVGRFGPEEERRPGDRVGRRIDAHSKSATVDQGVLQWEGTVEGHQSRRGCRLRSRRSGWCHRWS